MLGGISSPVHEITKCIHIAFLCVQESVVDRPKMIEVLQMLNNLSIRLPEPLDPGLFIRGSISSEASSQCTKNEMSISDLRYRRKMRKRKAESYAKSVKESSLSDGINLVESHVKYEFKTIQNATDNFSKENELGGGGFGVVYKGKLENMQLVAVKRLPINLKLGNAEFKSQVALMTNLQHKNLVRLLGFCHEGEEMILVYEFVPNGGLDDMLFHPVKCGYLNWGRRYEIIESIGKGLVYLHEDSRLRIVHRDLKASNILLDANLNPKIADFNLAYSLASDKALGFKDKWSVSLGYAPPECSFGEFSIKTYVYSFGILILEIISRQKCFNLQIGGSIEYLSSYVWKQWREGSSLKVIDPMLTGISSPVDDIIKCIQVALLCVQENAKDRPTMGEVVQMLSNLSSVSLPVPSAPPYLPESSDEDSISGISISGMSISDGEYPR
nr:putative receptor-like protein kinase At4g00960 [Ipomoea batatas]